MEQRFFTVTIHRPMTRVERLRLRRRRFWSRVCLVLGILTAAAVLTAAVLAAGSDARSEKPAQEISTTNPAPVLTLAVAEEPQEEPESRYAPISADERELIARVVYLEARGEPAEGQQAVAEVILNRVAAENFPDRIADVIHQENPQQFTTAPYIDKAEPGAEQYAAVDAALYGEPVLPLDVVYFSREPENGNLWGIIGGHSFCYQYNWK
jgi:hypothetical protein